MKAMSAVEFVGFVIAVVFIIGVIVILLYTFLPQFSADVCRTTQIEDINKMFSDAQATNSRTIRQFVVQSCMEFVDFSELECKTRILFPEREEIKRCYEFLEVGQVVGNCADFESLKKYDVDGKEIPQTCEQHKGTLGKIPESFGTFDISCNECSAQQNLDLRYKPGRYSVEIGPYSIKFLQSPS